MSFPSPTRSGLSLLELLVALLILQIAITGFAQFFMGGLDLSKQTRTGELAQILAQNKMEELLRTVPASAQSEAGLWALNDRPRNFDDSSVVSPEAGSFRWIAESMQASHNPRLMTISLHVYEVSSRPAKTEAVSEQGFYLSDDRKRFTFFELAEDGSAQLVQGKEKVCLTSAVAVP
jgi:type II secretory pathway pseudopilin PulG